MTQEEIEVLLEETAVFVYEQHVMPLAMAVAAVVDCLSDDPKQGKAIAERLRMAITEIPPDAAGRAFVERLAWLADRAAEDGPSRDGKKSSGRPFLRVIQGGVKQTPDARQAAQKLNGAARLHSGDDESLDV